METWTEYAVQQKDGEVFQVGDCTPETLIEFVGKGDRLVGRQVTASDWLPVDQGGAS